MTPDTELQDARATHPVQRLLEDSWAGRERDASRHELLAESLAAALFLAVAIPLALPVLFGGRLSALLVALLVALYAIVARAVRFPIGAGHVVPSYLVLVPMLVLLPPGVVPLLAAAGLVLGSVGRLAARQAKPQELVFSVADAWHTLGAALVLWAAGPARGAALGAVYVAAFMAGGIVDLASSSVRERLALGIAPRLQGRVIAVVWMVDASVATLGLLVAHAARRSPGELLLLLPACGLLIAVDRDRTARIAQAQHRLGLVARERTRLQAAINRLGEALAAKLDLRALADVVLSASIDALDADAGSLALTAASTGTISETSGPPELRPLLEQAIRTARSTGRFGQFEYEGLSVLAVPFDDGGEGGAVAVAREGRAFGEDEAQLMRGLVDQAQVAVTDILAHEALREQALTDPLTRLGNRRCLTTDLAARLSAAGHAPLVLMLFDLDGFKRYNDTFGHVAGDALLARLGKKLRAAVSPLGSAYRLGGDEFCVLAPADHGSLRDTIAAAMAALEEHGEEFAISASCGTVLLPHEADSAEYALQLADERMYGHKYGRPSGAREQAQDVLIHIMQANRPDFPHHAGGVGLLAVAVGRRLGMSGSELDELGRAAALHDVGKVGVPDTILTKAGPLDPQEWSFVRQHTLLGERILSAAPALRPVATIVRATHERWDGGGYPDGLRGQEIPLAARIVAVCDAYDAITSDRCYRPARSGADARQELARESGRQFDPSVVEAFLAELEAQDHLSWRGADGCDEHRATYAADIASRIQEMLAKAA